nr:Gfo/Idh/MocA family oxidoreductase [Candidatus Sigynarchaeota archaeon]
MACSRFGIIGFGSFSERRLIPGFSGSTAVIHGITRRTLAGAREKASQYKIPLFFNDPESLVEHGEIDAVYIASPNDVHVEHARLAARHGKPVLCEKPMSTTIDDAISMSIACVTAGIPFMIAQCYRYAGSCMAIKDMIESGLLGDVLFIDAHYSFLAEGSSRSWIFSPEVAGGGPIFDIGVHMVDLVRFLMGNQELVQFQGFKKYYDPSKHPGRSIDSSGSLHMRFENDATAHVTCSFELPYQTAITVHGTEKTVSARNFTIVGQKACVNIYDGKDTTRPDETRVVENGNFYSRMIDAFSSAVESKQHGSIPGWRDGL